MCGRERDRLPQRIDFGGVVRQQFFHLPERVGVRRTLGKIENTRFRRQIHEFVEQLSHFGSHRALSWLRHCGGSDHAPTNSGVTTLARISHRLSTAARDKAASTSLRSLTVLDILFKYASAR